MKIFSVHLGEFIDPGGLTPPVVFPAYLPPERRRDLFDLLVSGLGNPPVLSFDWREVDLEPDGHRIVANGVALNTDGALLKVGIGGEVDFRRSLKVMPRVPALLVVYDTCQRGFVQHQKWLYDLNNMLVKTLDERAAHVVGQELLEEFDFGFLLDSLGDPLDMIDFMNLYVGARGQGLGQEEALLEAFGEVVSQKMLALEDPAVADLLRLVTRGSGQILSIPNDLGDVAPDSLSQLEVQNLALVSGQKLFLRAPTLRLRDVDFLEKAVNLFERERPLGEARQLYERFLRAMRPMEASVAAVAEQAAVVAESRMSVSLARVEELLRGQAARLSLPVDLEDAEALKALARDLLKREREGEKRALALMLRSYSHLKEQEFQEAWRDAALAYQSNAGLKDVYLEVLDYMGSHSLANWRLDDAIEYFRAVLAEDARSWSAYRGLGEAYHKLGEWDKAERILERALAEARETGDESGEAATLGKLGLVHADKGRWEKAIEFYQKSLEISEKLGDIRGLARTYNNLGNVYQQKGEWDQAIEFYQKDLEISEKLGDIHGLAQIYNNLGSVYADKGQWDQAIEFYQKSLETKEKLGDIHGMAVTYGNLGGVYHRKGKWERAIEFYQKSLETKEKLGDIHGMAQTYNNLGLVYADKGEWERAIEFYQNALEIMEKVGDIHGLAKTYNNLGLIYADKGQWEQAIEFYQNALETMEKVGDIHGMAQTYNNLGLVYAKKGEWEQAIEFYKKSLENKEKLGDIHGLAQTWVNLGNVYQLKGEWEQAIEFYKNALKIMEKVGDMHGLAQTWVNLGALYMEREAWEKALTHFSKSLQLLKKIGDRQNEAEALHYLGEVYRRQSEFDRALEHYHQSLTIKEDLEDPHGTAQTWRSLGLLYETQEDYEKALHYLEKSLEVFRRLGSFEVAKTEEYVRRVRGKLEEDSHSEGGQ